ncbi:MAG: thioesterase, partial [Alistipes sp.]
IDFNRHMNTLRYIDLLFDAMPLELVASQRAVRLDIHFLQECRHAQLLTLGSEQRGDTWLFTIHNGEQEAVRASVEWR